MPEGPEVQQVLNKLEPKVVGKQIVHVEVSQNKITIPLKKTGRQDVDLFKARLEGSIIKKLERKGKYLIFHCEQEDSSIIYMVSHLGMTGGFFNVQSIKEAPEKYQKHVHIVMTLNDESYLIYSDQRRFGWVGALNEEEYLAYDPVQKVGPDPAHPDAPQQFLTLIREKKFTNKPIKWAIMQPVIIQGVGNIYAAESLFRAKLHPAIPVGDLTDKQLLLLLEHIKNIFDLAIQMGGSSIRDYVNSEGTKGSFQEMHKVYNKKNCPECGTDLENMRIDNRSSFYCPNCQKR